MPPLPAPDSDITTVACSRQERNPFHMQTAWLDPCLNLAGITTTNVVSAVVGCIASP